MAKVVITIEDNKDGSVKLMSKPNFLDLMRMTREVKNRMTSAHSYALTAINAVRDSSRLLDQLNKMGVSNEKRKS